ncbi:MAG: helix-turn-helix domain-containing protein [Deltaproteobacteria bacterium]|nr:helix-turn-helix domain-containing protein [Deltaproteobacteria bacterium]
MIDNRFKSERLWDIDKLAETLGITKSWIYSQTFQNKIPFRKIAGKLRFDPIEIDAWIESQPGWSLKTFRDSAPRKKEEQS